MFRAKPKLFLSFLLILFLTLTLSKTVLAATDQEIDKILDQATDQVFDQMNQFFQKSVDEYNYGPTPTKNTLRSGYKNYLYSANINIDSSIDVEESFDYINPPGQDSTRYFISLLAITPKMDTQYAADTQGTTVIDSATNIELDKFSVKKTDDRRVQITWYNSPNQEERKIKIKYKLINALTFPLTEDKLDLRIFGPSYYDEINTIDNKATIKVSFPKNIKENDIKGSVSYFAIPTWAPKLEITFDRETNSYIYKFEKTQSSLGIQQLGLKLHWPAGEISRRSEVVNTFKFVLTNRLMPNKGYTLAFFIILFFFLTPIFNQVYKKTFYFYKKSSNALTPEYEPPMKLTPAMVDVIINGRTTQKTWPITIADLIARKVINLKTIEEIKRTDKKSVSGNLRVSWYFQGIAGSEAWFAAFFITVPVLILEIILIEITTAYVPSTGITLGNLFLDKSNTTIPLNFFIIFLLYYFIPLRKVLNNKHVLEKAANFSTENLLPYEKKLINLLFGSKQQVYVRSLLVPASAYVLDVENFYEKNQEIERSLYEEITKIPDLYKKAPTAENQNKLILFLTIITYLFLIPIFASFSGRVGQYELAFVLLLLSLIAIITSLASQPRLTTNGVLVRLKILGFKYYLEIAEKYRLKELPDTDQKEKFEKFLPYAMLFNIERKWASSMKYSIAQIEPWDEGKAFSLIIWKLIFYLYYPLKPLARFIAKIEKNKTARN